jgi:hypothetical protein
MTTPPSCLALSGRSAQRRHRCRRDAPRRVAHVEWDGHRPGRRSRMAEQPGFGGSNGPAGDAVRPRGRGEHRLPGRGGRTGRPGVEYGLASNIEVFWEEPSLAAFLRRLSEFTRLILFDRRGCGLSDGTARRPRRHSRSGWTTSLPSSTPSVPTGLDPWDLRGRLAGGTVRGDPSGADSTHHPLRNPHPLRRGRPVSGGCGRRHDRRFRRGREPRLGDAQRLGGAAVGPEHGG